MTAYQLLPGQLRVRVMDVFRDQFSGTEILQQAAEENLNGCSAKSDPGYLVWMSFCGFALLVILSET